MSPRARTVAFLIAAAGLAPATPAAAHPHIFIDAKAELVFAGPTLSAIRHTWQFDSAFSAFAVQGLDANHDGKLSADELAPLAALNIKGLVDYGYYTYAMVDQKNVELAAASDYHVEWSGSRLTLFFTLPLKQPAPVKASAAVQIFDLEYYTAFTFPPDAAFTLSGAPVGCSGSYVKPQPLDEATLQAIYAIPANQRTVPPDLRRAVAKLANIVTVTCT
jgi:ABC-type uncharacterized transport system substrate-binding protein